MNDTIQQPDTNLGSMRLRSTISQYVLTFVMAISMTMMGPLIPVYMKQYGITLGEGGLISLFQGLGALAALVAGVFFTDRLDKTVQIKTSAFIYSISVIIIALINSYVLLVGIFFVLGASTRLLNAVLNANVADINAARRGFYASLLQACFGLGAFLGPMLSIFFINLNMPTNIIFLSLGAACIIAFIQFTIISAKIPREAKIAAKTNNADIWIFMKDSKMLLLNACMFLYAGISTSLSMWMPSYMQQILNSGVVLSGYPVSGFWIGVISGRIIFSIIQEKMDTRVLLMVCLAFGGAFFAASLFMHHAILIIIASGILGLVSGVLVPLSISIACTLFPKNTGTVTLIMYIWSAIAQLSVTWVLGLLVNPLGFSVSMMLIGLLTVLAGVFEIFLPSREKLRAKC